MTPEQIFADARRRGIKQIRLVIFQPRVYNGPVEWTCTLDKLEEFAKLARERAAATEAARRSFGITPADQWERMFLNPQPNEDECAFCKAMPTCPAARRKLEADVGADFEVVGEEGQPPTSPDLAEDDKLNTMMKAVPLLEDFCKSIRAEVERRLLAGTDVPDFGLELGRQGPRKWKDPEEVERILRKQFVLKAEHVFNFKLRSPTQIEDKLAPKEAPKRGPNKGVVPESILGKRQWAKLQPLIVRSEPRPSVKPKSVIKTPFKAEAIRDDFTTVNHEEDDLA